MTIQEKRSYERFLKDSFQSDIFKRELRLTDDELHYLLELMPRASVIEMPDSVCHDGKRWYEVSLSKYPDISEIFSTSSG